MEETCLIKTKRWNDSLMPVLDALCMLHSYYTSFFFFLRGSCSGLDGGRCCRHKEGEEDGVSLMKFLIIPPPLAQWRITECHLGQCSLWNYIYEIHLSLFFFYSFCLFLSVPLPPLTSSTSNWRCHKGVRGQWFFKVKLTLMRSYRHMWTDAVAPTAPFSASLIEPQILHPGVCASRGLTHSTCLQ